MKYLSSLSASEREIRRSSTASIFASKSSIALIGAFPPPAARRAACGRPRAGGGAIRSGWSCPETMLMSSRTRSWSFTEAWMSASVPVLPGGRRTVERLRRRPGRRPSSGRCRRPARRSGPTCAWASPPMRDRPRRRVLEARLLPDVGILGRRRAEGDEPRRLVAEVPGDAVEPRPARAAGSLRITVPSASRISSSTGSFGAAGRT